MTIEELGGRVASVWDRLRPDTKQMLTGALRSGGTFQTSPRWPKFLYDAHADLEVSSLLSALDEQSRQTEVRSDVEKLGEITRLADICVRVLESQSASAEVFIQLAERALKDSDYKRLDKLADRLGERYSAAEMAEIIRQSDMPQIRALAYESLAMMPVPMLLSLIDDPLYSDIAAFALEQKAYEFDSAEARDLLEDLDAGDSFTGQ